ATVAEAKELRGKLHGHHIKNLFLRDRKRRFFLVTVPEDRVLDLKALREPLGAKGTLSFATHEHLKDVLGLLPGAVTPFAVLNDTDNQVTLVLDPALQGEGAVFCHPLHNAASVGLSGDALVTFVVACDHPPIWLLPA
ncbi:MAG: Ala-tRNA(Pro) deacylase, partial [Myxococcota bacterium]